MTVEHLPDMHSSRPGSPIDVARLAAGLWRFRWLFVGIFVVGSIIGYALTRFVMAPDYLAKAAVVWEPVEIREAAAQHRKLRTLAASIELPRNLEEVKRRTGIPLSVEQMADAIIADVRANSNLLVVYGRTKSPGQSAELVNTAIDVFIEEQREAVRLQVEEIIDAAKRVRDAALAEMQAARQSYDKFREQEGILDLRVERTAAIEKAALLETTADHARAELEAQIERVRVLTQAKGKLTDKVIMSETESLPAALALAKARSDLEQLRGVLTEDHPKIQALAAQVATLEKQLDTKLGPVVGQRVVVRNPQRDPLENGLLDAEASEQAARQRERVYNEMKEATKRELAELIRLEGKAGELITVLDLAEKRYADAEAAVARAEDIARTRTTGLRLASPATIPDEAVPGRRRTLVAMAVPFFLLVVAALLVLIFRLRALRASSSREIAFWGDGPVLTVVGWPSGERTVHDVCIDLRVPLRESADTTLIVPFSEREAALGRELFDCLLEHIDDKDEPGTGTKERVGEKATAKGARKGARGTVEGANIERHGQGEESSQAEGPSILVAGPLTIWLNGDETDLRRACRDAARVLVIIEIREHSHFSVSRLKTRLGRDDGLGFMVVNVGWDLDNMPDRVGDVAGFWSPPGEPVAV